MSKPEFKKGQRVNVYFGSFETADVTVQAYIVASCGLKQLHMVRDDGSNAEFRLHAPFRRERMYSDVQCASVDVAAHTLTLRRRFAAWTREHYANRTENAERLLREGGIGAQGYAKAIAEGKAKFESATADL
jgi:hypothetical protein